MQIARRHRVTDLRRIHRNSRNSRLCSPMMRLATKCGPLKRSRRIWSRIARWIACSVVTWATARPRSRSGQHLSVRLKENRWPYLCRLPFWLSSTMRPSVNGSQAIQLIFRCSAASAAGRNRMRQLKESSRGLWIL
ncbi:hypothetical protein D3C85_1348280 [compost metagenome]